MLNFNIQRIICLIFCALLGLNLLSAQVEVRLKNSSFEGASGVGSSKRGVKLPLAGWQNWSSFPGKTTPDIHGRNTKLWDVTTNPFHGDSFLGMVTRADETWESIAQYLEEPLKQDVSYVFSVYLCQDSLFFYTDPAILRIWGANSMLAFDELLAESDNVTNHSWKEYTFDLIPENDYKYLVLQVYFPPNIVSSTAGHIMIDKARLFKYE